MWGRRNRRNNRSTRFPNVDVLEKRVVLSWPGAPPQVIPIPVGPVAVTLNNRNDAAGAAAIGSTEVDYYSFIAPSTGSYAFRTTTPTSNLDSVLGVFNAAGKLVVGNNNAPGTTDSLATANLTAGARYYFGITNNAGTPAGAYGWSVNGPDDDKREQNDTFSTAWSLGTLEGKARTYAGLQARDADWFRFATVQPSLGPSDFVRIDFQHAQGNLELHLFNSVGQLLTSSTGTSDSEVVSLNGLPAGSYYIRIVGAGGAENPNYSLKIDPPDDAYEQNDTYETAADLGTITGDLRVTGLQLLDDDWYRFTPIEDGISSHTIRVVYTQEQGEVTLAAYDGLGGFIDFTIGSSGLAFISLPPDIPGPISMKVSASGGYKSADYTVEVSKDFPDDDKEENDKPSKAYDLGALAIPFFAGDLSLGDRDYFQFTTNAVGGAGDKVRIEFNQTWGNLAMRLYKRVWDPATNAWQYNLVASSNTNNNFEQISLDGRPAETYVIYVYGVAGAKNPIYSLSVDPP